MVKVKSREQDELKRKNVHRSYLMSKLFHEWSYLSFCFLIPTLVLEAILSVIICWCKLF